MDVTRKSARKWIDSLSLRVQQALFAAATYLILLAICLLAISPEQYDLSVGGSGRSSRSTEVTTA